MTLLFLEKVTYPIPSVHQPRDACIPYSILPRYPTDRPASPTLLARPALLLQTTCRLPRLPFLLHALAPRRLAHQILHCPQNARLHGRGCVLVLRVAHLLQAGLFGRFARLIAECRRDSALCVLLRRRGLLARRA
jgi:hypothetical protein